MNKLFAAIIAVSLCGCATSSIVTKRGSSKSQFAPVNEKAIRGGTAKYLAQGWDSGIAKRREDAYKKMSSACNGEPYKIIREYVQEGDGSAITTGQFTTYGGEKWMYLDFACEDHLTSHPSANAN